MRLYSGALVKMTGGVFKSCACDRIYGFKNTIELSGDAQFLFADPTNSTVVSLPIFQRDMTVKMSGNSVISNKPARVTSGTSTIKGRAWQLKSNSAGQTFLLEMSDNAVLDVWGKSADTDVYGQRLEIGLGNQSNPSYTGMTRVMMHGNSGIETGTSIHLGKFGGSTGIVEMADNTFITQRNYITDADHSYSIGMSLGLEGKSTEIPAVGILKMSGGCVRLLRTVAYENSKKWQPQGLVVGDGYNGDFAGNVAIGRIEMTGGTISNGLYAASSKWSAFLLGARSARGEIVQSGGEIAHWGNHPLVIGFSGGEGVYDMAGGELEILESPESAKNYLKTTSNIYVGGASISDAGYDPTNTTDGKYANWKDRFATGSLTVSGGVVRTTGSIYVSSHGYGTLEIGKAGRIEANSLYLTNSTVSGVTAPAKLKVTLGESGCGTINLSGTCQIAEDARLEIDGSAFFSDGICVFPVVSCTSVEGCFAPENITVVGRGKSRFKLRQSSTGLEVVHVGGGMMLIFK